MTDDGSKRVTREALAVALASIGPNAELADAIFDALSATPDPTVGREAAWEDGAGFAADRPTGPRTEKGHALASRLRTRMPDAEVDWDQWIRAIEDAAEAWGKFHGMTLALAAAPSPTPGDGLDVERLARALHVNVDDRVTYERCPQTLNGWHRQTAEILAAEYARLTRERAEGDGT